MREARRRVEACDGGGDGVIDVTWTERKHVRKPRGAPPGRVSVADGRNVAVRMNQSRIDRLYAAAPVE